jgi:hypothetical protein
MPSDDLGIGLEVRRRNAQKLIAAGRTLTPGTDSYWATAAELSRTPKFQDQDHGSARSWRSRGSSSSG